MLRWEAKAAAIDVPDLFRREDRSIGILVPLLGQAASISSIAMAVACLKKGLDYAERAGVYPSCMDADSELPAELRAFLYSCIDSLDQVELLITLRRAPQARSVRHLATATGRPPHMIRRDLETLVVRGLLRADVGAEVGYRYAPENPELGRYADLLDANYVVHREQILKIISSRSARAFADAFKIKKNP